MSALDEITRANPILDLNSDNHKFIVKHIGERIDNQLVIQCAYYPRPGAFGKPSPCLQCSFDKPFRQCKKSSILLKTRVGIVYKEKNRVSKQELRSKADDLLAMILKP